MPYTPQELKYFREEGHKIAAEIAVRPKYVSILRSIRRKEHEKIPLVLLEYINKIGYGKISPILLMNVISSLQQDFGIKLKYKIEWLTDEEAMKKYSEHF